MVKPIFKWCGSKSRILNTIVDELGRAVAMGGITNYVEPFLGTGVVLTRVIETFNGIKGFYAGDIIPALALAMRSVRNNPESLIDVLKTIYADYLPLVDIKDCKEYYKYQRKRFNTRVVSDIYDIETAGLFLFVTSNCFNGSFTLNQSGEMNAGYCYRKIKINYENLLEVSKLLKRAVIQQASYEYWLNTIQADTLVYLDPPYRYVTKSQHTYYTPKKFTDDDQFKLSLFCREIDKKGGKFVLSNADAKDGWIEQAYEGFNLKRIEVIRSVMGKGEFRNNAAEFIISNF